MDYVTHTRYKGKTMNGAHILARRGDVLERKGDILYLKGEPVCIYRSLVGKQHFARNDDGFGIQRGEITYALAYAPRLRYGGPNGTIQQRFTDEELEILVRDWGKYLKPNIDMLLFNDIFFEESLDVLRQIAASVNVEVSTM